MQCRNIADNHTSLLRECGFFACLFISTWRHCLPLVEHKTIFRAASLLIEILWQRVYWKSSPVIRCESNRGHALDPKSLCLRQGQLERFAWRLKNGEAAPHITPCARQNQILYR